MKYHNILLAIALILTSSVYGQDYDYDSQSCFNEKRTVQAALYESLMSEGRIEALNSMLEIPISETQMSCICGGPLYYDSYISFAESTIDSILLRERQEGRSAAGLGHLTKSDFNLMTEGAECTNLINHLDTFELKDSEEINPLQKPVFFKADEFYFVFYVTPAATVEQLSDGRVQIQGRISGKTTVLVFNSDLEGVALFVI
ncbi:MAG: hypothetical protein LAT84_06330 [Balneolia bacterium]|nr:hypothetical protein [Balneolia bacterium]